MRKFLFLFMLACFGYAQAENVVIYVSPSGNDTHTGTQQQPVATIARAQQLARETAESADVEVVLADGTYYLNKCLEFNASDNKHSVIYRAANEGQAVVSGGCRINVEWRSYKNGIYVADVDGVDDMDQLFVNGKRQRMARFPNAAEGAANRNVFDTWNLSDYHYDANYDALTSQRIARWSNPEGGYIHAMHELLWGDMSWRILGKNSDGSLRTEGGWQNCRQSNMHSTLRFVENIFEELDAPGEWYFNKSEKKLYYYPKSGEDLQTALIEGVRLERLIHFEGNQQQPVQGITLQGIIFRHCARMFMDNREHLLRSDWTISRSGAVLFEGAVNCTLSDCEFDQVGGNAVFASGFNKHLAVRHCHIHDGGASGVVFVGLPKSVRSAAFETDDPVNYDALSREKGPQTDDYPDSCSVEDCLINHNGRDEKQTAGVQISMSHAILVSHCSIYDSPRAGVNISEGAFGGHRIQYCDIFDNVLETGDHGSFNSWGRDRHWMNNSSVVVAQVDKDPNLPYYDMLDRNELCYTRWRCDHGWDIDLDDGSTGYDIHHNVLLKGGLKLREGYRRNVYNNVIVNNSLHPHVWYRNGEDQFYRNIVCTAYQPASMNATIANDGKWGKTVDYNFFACNDAARTAFAGNGCDAHSLSGYPMFVDSVAGDYRVKEGSLALTIGFENFDMDNFGVEKSTLKALARTPEIPSLDIKLTQPGKQLQTLYYWMGTTLREPTMLEFSAYGVGFEEGGVLMGDVEDDTEAARQGFKSGDLLLTMNGEKVSSLQELMNFLNSSKSKEQDIVVNIVRDQHRTTITIHPPLPNVVVKEEGYPVPGRVEAEAYSNESGVQVCDCSDEGVDGQCVGYVDTGDWMEYPIDVEAGGLYRATFRCAIESQGSTMQILLDGEQLTTASFKATGSWFTYENFPVELNLPEGHHTLRVVLTSYMGYNLNWIDLELLQANSAYESLQELIRTIETTLEYQSPANDCNSGRLSIAATTKLNEAIAEAKAFTADTEEATLRSIRTSLNSLYDETMQTGINPGGVLGLKGTNITTSKLVQASNFSRTDGKMSPRYGTPANWTVENFTITENYNYGTKNGIDSYLGHNSLMLGVWAENDVYTDSDLKNARIYRRITLEPGQYFFAATYDGNYQMSDAAYIFAVSDPLETKDIPQQAIAWYPVRNAGEYDGKYHGIEFEIPSTQQVCLGFQADLTQGATEQEFCVKAVRLIQRISTGVSGVATSDKRSTTYDLLGRPVINAQQRGIYIQGGKKMVK